jgi:O-antigen ligase
MNFPKFRLPYREDTAFGLLAFAVFVVPLAFSAFAYENFESVKFSLFLLCVGASGALFLLRQKQGKLVVKYNKYFYILLAGFGFWAIISSCFSLDYFYSVFGFYYRYTSGLVFYAAFLTFIFLLINFLDSGRLEYLLKILALDAFVIALISFLQSFGWIFYGGLITNGFFRGPSLLGNTDYSAMFLACALPLVIYLLYCSKSRGAKIYYSLSAFFIIIANLILASRAALLATLASLILALILLAIFKFPKKLFAALLLGFLAVLILGYFFLDVSRPQALTSIAGSVDVNTSSRFYAWEVSFRGISQHPALGSGPGAYALFFEKAQLPSMAGQFGVFDDAHNLFLQLAVTGGLPLCLIFIAIIAVACFYGLKRLSQEKDILYLVLLCSMAAWLIAASFNPVPVPMYMFFGVLAAGMLLKNLPQREVNFSLWAKFFLSVFAWLIFVFGGISLVSEHLLGAAARAYANGEYSAAGKLSSAGYAINPTNELFLIYRAASLIQLGRPGNEVGSDIAKIKSLHKTQSGSYVSASNLDNLLFSKGGDARILQLAAAEMETALQLNPLFAERYGQLALYYYQLGQTDKAQAVVLKDLTLNQGDFSAWILLAKLYQLQNNKPAVIFALTKAFDLQPNIPQLKYLLFLSKNLPNIKSVPIQINARQPAI